MVAEAVVAMNAMSAAPSKVARTRMTPIPQPPRDAAPPFKQLTMKNGSPKINLGAAFSPRFTGNCKLLAQFKNSVLLQGRYRCDPELDTGAFASLRRGRFHG